MTAYLFVFSMVLVLCSLSFMVRSIINLRVEMRQAIRTSSESIVRCRDAVNAIRNENEQLCNDLKLLYEASKDLPQAVTVVSDEAMLLVRNIKLLSSTMAMVSTLRKATW